MRSFTRHAIHAGRLQTRYLVHEAHGVVAVVIGQDEDDVHGLARLGTHQADAHEQQRAGEENYFFHNSHAYSVSRGFSDLFIPLHFLRLYISGIRTNHNHKFARLPVIFQIVIVKFQLLRRNPEGNGFGFACFYKYFLKSFQFLHRSGYRTHHITNVELHHFSTVAAPALVMSMLAVKVWLPFNVVSLSFRLPYLNEV